MDLRTIRLSGFAVAAGLFLSMFVSPVGAAEPCTFEASRIVGGTAIFVIGPVGCEGEVGPISFSSYVLPGGFIEPYEEQVLIEHSPGSGEMYGPGRHILGVSLGDACNWQTDLYRGMPKDSAPHHGRFFIEGGGVGWDVRSGKSCDRPIPLDPTPQLPDPISLINQGTPGPADTGHGPSWWSAGSTLPTPQTVTPAYRDDEIDRILSLDAGASVPMWWVYGSLTGAGLAGSGAFAVRRIRG